MTKRLAGTEIWEKNWFLDLNDKQKLLIKFLYDKCDCAGFYPICWRILKMSFTSEITKEDFEGLKQVRFVNDDTVFIEDFINFQYGIKQHSDLNPNNNVHKGIINRLKKYNCYQDNKAVQVISADNPINQAEILPKKIDPFADPIIDEAINLYSENCPDLCAITTERKNSAVREEAAKTLNEINKDMEQFKRLCKEANNLKKIAETKIDFKTMCKNYIGILNGKYKREETKSQADLYRERRRQRECEQN